MILDFITTISGRQYTITTQVWTLHDNLGVTASDFISLEIGPFTVRDMASYKEINHEAIGLDKNDVMDLIKDQAIALGIL